MLWMQQQIQSVSDIRDDDICCNKGSDGQSLCPKYGNAQLRSLQHVPVVGSIADRNNAIHSEPFHELPFPTGFCARCHLHEFQAQPSCRRRAPAKCICG